jgi:hypothetical protein
MALSIERSPCKETAEGPTAKMSRHNLQDIHYNVYLQVYIKKNFRIPGVNSFAKNKEKKNYFLACSCCLFIRIFIAIIHLQHV